jgi:hypothetical protein
MTAAHTAVVRTLRALLHHQPDIALREGPLPGRQLGHVHYPSRTITISPNANDNEWCTALMYGLLQLDLGSFTPDRDVRARTVLDEMARRLVPLSGLPPDSDPHTVASTYGVEISVARHAITLARYARAEGAA